MIRLCMLRMMMALALRTAFSKTSINLLASGAMRVRRKLLTPVTSLRQLRGVQIVVEIMSAYNLYHWR